MRLQDRRRRAIGRAFRPDHAHHGQPWTLSAQADRGRGRSCRLPAKSRAKIPAGKKQMLSILPIDLIKVVKIAAIEDGLKLSGAVEEALRD